jgi:hypothetical protein
MVDRYYLGAHPDGRKLFPGSDGKWVKYTDYAALAEQLAACQRDAERYRWLRDVQNQGARSKDGSGLIVCADRPNAEFARYIGPVFGPNLDAAIDASMTNDAEAGR